MASRTKVEHGRVFQRPQARSLQLSHVHHAGRAVIVLPFSPMRAEPMVVAISENPGYQIANHAHIQHGAECSVINTISLDEGIKNYLLSRILIWDDIKEDF